MTGIEILVQKFGGTSLATAAGRSRAIEHIRQALHEGFAPVVVVSAMGRRGDPYATDTLLELIPEARTERETDLLLATGEIISSVVLAGELRHSGLKSQAFTGGEAGLQTDGHFGEARILKVDPHRLTAAISEGIIPVVAGFQGTGPQSEMTTLGRGGSDTTAVALGIALKAQAVEIYTDVDGFKTADPGVIPDAPTIDQLTYEESFQLAQKGAKVIHPRAVELAWGHQIPLRIRSTFLDRPGTLITFFGPGEDPWAARRSERSVTGVTSQRDIIQVIVTTGEDPGAHLAIFQRFAQAGISVDLINIFPDRKSFVIEQKHRSAAESLLAELKKPWQIIDRCAKVTVVGSAIHGLPGVLANLLAALTEENIPLLATADSHLSISCLIPESDLEAAVRALYSRFELAALAKQASERGLGGEERGKGI